MALRMKRSTNMAPVLLSTSYLTGPLLAGISMITFTSSGLTIKDPGWTKVYPSTIEEKDCPTLNGPVKIDKIEFLEKETQPPKRYTAASLVSLLEKKNLGTKTTRSMIVDTLFNRDYLDGKSIKATPLGKKLIEALEEFSPIIIDESLTRNLEEKMEEIQKTKENLEEKEKQIRIQWNPIQTHSIGNSIS